MITCGKIQDGQATWRRLTRERLNAGVEKNGSGNIGTKERENADGKNAVLSGSIGTILQGWKMQEWKHRHDRAGVEMRELKLSNCNNMKTC